uniref:TLC domain-containing protein n=1 Tax=Craspedostauros australis TaxID=1486917 RepID=A0A7R9WMQ1_9STRA|mmetsp:Transcript_12504/g.34452  ORF Transcript_12504/g.34452 Transcript_12504/m.34452 type:complete len:312 (+) Transcript_12504:297-1232(+)|eukprot:CAMPEP_0198115950 /NCGR_PEP_ID=MMETSP1442-20131203/8482_1 /TAXON_ID= /ORGANISM="Craspedostauros australis, Strain CCMP3328" /LENGTH=311 /DNA_ID=CAMNT_0043773581 /DNA_START=225 /DNA_END=1160 /DNA_ORIENTATION=+
MCKANTATTTSSGGGGISSMLLLSVDSYVGEKGGLPCRKKMAVTGAFFFTVLLIIEKIMQAYFDSIKDSHWVLASETNRHILARHIGIDSLSCFVVAYLGYKCRHMLMPIYNTVILGKNDMPPAGYDKRLFTYQPESQRINLFFFSYQIKNLYDTIVWGDGPEFIMHHIICLFTAWGSMFPGTVHNYVPFYFGISEISTAVLCLLANFDDEHGAIGLGEAWPTGKAVLGGAFAVLFIICRVFLWSTVSYYYCRDAWNALCDTENPRMLARKTYLQFTYVALGLLSVLQVLWLGQIFMIAHEELVKMGYIDA